MSTWAMSPMQGSASHDQQGRTPALPAHLLAEQAAQIELALGGGRAAQIYGARGMDLRIADQTFISSHGSSPFRLQIYLSVHEQPSLAGGAARAGDFPFSPATQREDVPLPDRSVRFIGQFIV